LEAATEPCDDFPEPEDPVSLSSASSSSSFDDDDDTSTVSPTTDTTTPDDGCADSDGDGFPDCAYNPGTDPEVPDAAPPPDTGGGPPDDPGDGNAGGVAP
jgi:hypothetical protein